MKKLTLFVCLIGFFAKAQQSVFYSQEHTLNRNTEKFGLEIYNLNFIKNNEYFNFIADGYTLLGSQLHPELIYNHSKNTQFKVGTYIQKNFGENRIDEIIPTFSFNYFNENHQFTIGNLFARNNHNLIEPVMASEKILTKKVIETGVNYKYKSKIFYTDVWLNWENYIIKNDDSREFFTLGISGYLSLLNNNKNSLKLPISSVFYHRGGQINKKLATENSAPLSTLDLNTTTLGLTFDHQLNEYNSFTFSYHFLLSKVSKDIEEFPFTKGNAHYFIGSFKSPKFEFSLAYFKANKFISAKGNDMFQTYSTRVENNYTNNVLIKRYSSHTEKDRGLLFSKANYKKNLTEKIIFGLQVEGFYQLNDAKITALDGFEESITNQFDFSYAVYVKFNDIFSF